MLTFNGGSANATALDAATGGVVGTLALGGKPEFAVADGHGGVFVNIEDRSEIVWLDAATLTIRARWPLAGCEEPTGLALDRVHQRLFSTCGNGRMAVVDGDGHVIALLPIGRGVDGCMFDPRRARRSHRMARGLFLCFRRNPPTASVSWGMW